MLCLLVQMINAECGMLCLLVQCECGILINRNDTESKSSLGSTTGCSAQKSQKDDLFILFGVLTSVCLTSYYVSCIT